MEFKHTVDKQLENTAIQEDKKFKRLQSIKSAQCLHPHNKNNKNFEQMNKKFIELRKMSKQKQSLINELTLLKQGAVSALLEKEDIINHLKDQSQTHWHFEDQKEQMQKQINKLIRKNKDIIEENNQLMISAEKGRKFFFEELYNKQLSIDQHLSEIGKLENQLNQLAQQNNELHSNLSEQQFKVRNLEIEIQTLKIQFLNFKIETKIPDNNQNEELIYKLQVMEQQRKQQIQQIISYYQNQINILHSLYIDDLSPGKLKKTLQTQEYSQAQERDSVNELTSIKTYLKPELLNLKMDLIKNLDSNRKSSEGEISEACSQFSNKYFQHINKYHNNHNSSALNNIKRYSVDQETFKRSYKIPESQLRSETSIPVRDFSNLIMFEQNYQIATDNQEQDCSSQSDKPFNKLKKNKTINNKLYYSAAIGFTTGAIFTCVIKKIFN